MLRYLTLIGFIWLVSSANSVNYTSCLESSSRTCVYGTNVTDRLLSMKKGGSNVLSTADYDTSFFPCEEYNYNCGYQEKSSDFLTVSNGVQLNMTYSQLLSCVPSDTTLTNTIKPYLGLSPSTAQCVSNVFPLQLTDTQSTTMMTGYLNRLTANLSSIYNAKRASYAPTWANLNINIKTAVLQMAKYNMNQDFLGGTFWNNFLFNNWVLMSNQLKANHSQNNCPQCLHSAYLIDSVTTRCNKYQSISFLVDESGSIGAGPFQYARKFLYAYVNQTYDDLSIMSIHFFDSAFDPWIYYGNNRASILNLINSKAYRGGGTATGNAINASVNVIKAKNFPNGVPKILVIMTDGGSYDSVIQAANYARANGIILFCVGIGGNVNKNQLLQIAGSSSNIVYISSYSNLDALVSLIENYFCKQIIDVNLNVPVIGNVVRVPTSPSYFRVQRSTNSQQYYMLSLIYQSDPMVGGQVAKQSHFDPFPDNFSQFASSKSYRTGILTKQYFISPQANQDIPIKKTLTVNQAPDRSFVSVAGTSLNFNITLTTCKNLNCSDQIAYAASIGSQNPDNQDNNPNSDGQSSSNSNSNIFMAIGLGVGLMGMATAGVIYGLRKFSSAPEKIALNQQRPDGDNHIDADNQNVSHIDNQNRHHHDHDHNRHHRDGDRGKNRKNHKSNERHSQEQSN